MKYFFNILFSLTTICSYSQKTTNFDFEVVDKAEPTTWKSSGSDAYTMSEDTATIYSGVNAAAIEYAGNSPNFAAWICSIPAKYKGDKIKLSGYIKTENVSGGWAGLLLRIDPKVGFDNMKRSGVTGTINWTRFEIELDLHPNQAQTIIFGGLLVGTGKMWFDDLIITIDGKNLADAELKSLFSAEKDTTFNNGSGIILPEINEKLTADLALLGKIWGFLKYHHPEIGKGNYNWDYELFRLLPEYLKNKTALERDQLLFDWITRLGKIGICDACEETSEDAFLKPDLRWIVESDLSESLKEKLYYIQRNRHQGAHFYIGMTPNIGNPQFNNEAPYANMPYPDVGFRLLALYRYWNAIQYFFPYKYLIDKNWDRILTDYIPLFINANNKLDYELTTVQLIGEIQDTHASILGGTNSIAKWKGTYYPPIHVRFIEDQLVITDYYNYGLKETVGLEIGDIITKINGIGVDSIVDRIRKFYPASNEPTRLRDISTDLLRSSDKNIEISYIRNSVEQTQNLALYERSSLNIYRWYKPNDENSYRLLNDSIGYVTLESIQAEDVEEIKNLFKNTRGIIIDIRNYPSTFIPFSLGSYFVSDTSAFAKFTVGSVNNPGEFTFTEAVEIPGQRKPYKGKLVILVNEFSQSQAEYTAMAFRAGVNTTVIGNTTAGADGNVSGLYLPGALQTTMSGIGVYYPSGKETQRLGIIPDIVVKPTIQGIKEGKDELLERAIEFINK